MFSNRAPQSSQNQRSGDVFNILLFGETGSGKSTLINYLTNFFNGGTLTNLKIAIPTKHHRATEGLKNSEKDIKDSTKSQTSECTSYEFRRDGCLFNFIDTPGLSDTEGTKKDSEHIIKIMAAAEERGSLTAIIIIINGSQSRATVNLRNTLFLLKGSVPDILLKNVVVVLTNCSKASSNFDLEQLKPWTVPKDNIFHMNNSALSQPVDVWIDDEDTKPSVERDWKLSLKVIDQLLERLNQLGNKTTEAFKEMRVKRNKIKSELHEILLEVKKLQDLQNELDDSNFAQKNISSDIEKYSNYKQAKKLEYVEFEQSNFYSTICSSCSKVCYEDWTSSTSIIGQIMSTKPYYDIINTVGNFLQTICGRPLCEKCNCSRFSHYDDTKKPVKKSKTVEAILEEMKEAYDHTVSRNDEMQTKISGLNADIESLKRALDAKEAAIQQCCEDLKSTCSQFNFVDELSDVIDIMEKDARTLASAEARADASNRIKNIKKVIDKLSGDK